MHMVFLAQFAGSVEHGMVYGHYYLAREWVRKGHQATIVAGVPAHNRFREPDCEDAVTEEWIDGIRYLWVKCVPYTQHQWLRRIFNIFSFVANTSIRRLPITSADAVICSSHQPLAILAAERMAKRWSAKLLFEVRDLWPLSLIEMSGSSKLNPFIMLLQWAEDRAYKKAAAVVSVLPYAKEYMVSRGMVPEKFNYIPNGVDIAATGESEPLPAFHTTVLSKIHTQDFCIGYAGNLGYANALDGVLKALAGLPPNVKFFVVGKGPAQEQLLNEAEQLGVADRLYLLPPIAKTQVPTFLSRMDVLYIGLQHKEVFRHGVSPTKINDYLLAKKPVIYAINVPHEAIDEGGAGIHCYSDQPDTIRTAIKEFQMMSPAARKAMGEKGEAWIYANRDYKVLAQQFVELIDSIPASAMKKQE